MDNHTGQKGEEDAGVLCGSQGKIAGVVDAEEIEEKAGDGVEEGDGEDGYARAGFGAVGEEDNANKSEGEEAVIEAEVVATSAIGELGGEDEVREGAGVVVDEETADTANSPACGEAEGCAVGIEENGEFCSAEAVDSCEGCA